MLEKNKKCHWSNNTDHILIESIKIYESVALQEVSIM